MKNHRKNICFLLLLTGLFLSHLQLACASDSAAPVVKQDYSVLAGEWQRTDGGYIVKVSDVGTDGKARVEYFNPRSIHVEHAAITTEKGLKKLFIKLQDRGYENSTYSLYYYAEKDALAGFYYQATLDRTYKVIFMRRRGTGK
ncbi:MAG: hypothetical protein JKY62_11435 [Desulfocapsa sp.]|nr:hypothetical protein [Desulfocapsa sp.]